MFGFAKDKREARITTEFFVNAIHVMAGANALEDESSKPQDVSAGEAARAGGQFTTFHNYVALPRSEAFRIEYWALEEAKLQRMPPEQEFSRKIASSSAAPAASAARSRCSSRAGAHVVVADHESGGAEAAASEAPPLRRPGAWRPRSTLTSRDSMRAAIRADRASVRRDRRRDQHRGDLSDAGSLHAARNRLGQGAQHQRHEQSRARAGGGGAEGPGLARVDRAHELGQRRRAKGGSEPYDVSKAAINHLIRELAIGLGPHSRQRHRSGNGGRRIVDVPTRSRHRLAEEVQDRLHGDESTEALRGKLAEFYAQRTITRRPIMPADCANAIVFLAGDLSARPRARHPG